VKKDHTLLTRSRISRKAFRTGYVRKADGKLRYSASIPDGDKSGMVTITVDIDALFWRLAVRALESKRGKAQALRGCVAAEVTDFEHTSEASHA
jgi:hypothetical protein